MRQETKVRGRERFTLREYQPLGSNWSGQDPGARGMSFAKFYVMRGKRLPEEVR